MRGIILLIALMFVINYAYADDDIFKGPVSVTVGFLNGEEFLKLSKTEKASYSMGIVDGYLSAPIFGADAKYINWISTCTKSKTNTQLAAILNKYLEDNPGRWEKSVQFLMIEALKKACDK